jgi:hypothetical protein
MEREGPYETMLRKIREASEEAVRLANEMVRILEEQEDLPRTCTCLDMMLCLEQRQMLVDVLSLCLKIQQERNPEAVRNVSRQLRRWLKEEGKGERGWIEVRTIRGNTSIYYRWREPGERKLHTEYYGRGDMLLCDLAVGVAWGTRL